MGNGLNMGKNNQVVTGSITNTVTIKKSSLAIGLTLSISVVIICILITIFSNSDSKGISILGKWVTSDGEYIEFLSDGIMNTNIHKTYGNPDTYELLEEGYLKWGIYDAGWIQYDYTYWTVDMDGDRMTLTFKDDNTRRIILNKA